MNRHRKKMNAKIKVLVVDDSLMMRKEVSEMLAGDDDIEVAGVAMDGDFALLKLVRMQVDVVVLDIQMPRMDGLSVLKVIQEKYHVPTIILSAFTRDGAYLTMQALRLGAVDFICKPAEGSLRENRALLQRALLDKVKLAHLTAAKSQPASAGERTPNRPQPTAAWNDAESRATVLRRPADLLPNVAIDISQTNNIGGSEADMQSLPGVIAIGASTGGTQAVEKIVQQLPAGLPVGIVVVQHMPKEFTTAFAETLGERSRLPVMEAKDGQSILAGSVYIAPGDCHLKLKRGDHQYLVCLDRQTPPINGLRPSVDILFHSAAQAGGRKVLAVILTGMGKDGATGIEAVKKAGGQTIAQNEETCVVFGMPKEAIKTGAVDYVLPLHEIPWWICKYAGVN